MGVGAGCTLNYPPGWTPIRDNAALWIDGPGAGYFLIQLLVPGSYTTAESQLQLAVQLLRGRFPDLVVTSSRDAPLPAEISAMGGRVLVANFHFSLNGQQAGGRLQLPFVGCSPWTSPCTVVVYGIWSSRSSLQEHACTLKAIASTFHCPRRATGDSCDDESCKTKCQSMGYREGGCLEDRCSCIGKSSDYY